MDGQLFQTFDAAKEYLRQEPVQIEDKDDLITQLSDENSEELFSTIQKFLPRKKKLEWNYSAIEQTSSLIHRSQYDMLDGFAAQNDAFPNASFIGFMNANRI